MTKSPTTALAAPLGAGAFVAVGLGIYGAVHEPTGRDFVLAGFAESPPPQRCVVGPSG